MKSLFLRGAAIVTLAGGLFVACSGNATHSPGAGGAAGAASTGGSSGSSASDGSAGSDGSSNDAAPKCVNVDLSTYDQSCQADSDCVIVTGGAICSNGCACGGSIINVAGLARYNAATAGVKPLQCPCATAGVPRCIAGRCTICGFGPNRPPGCGDGG